jgi:hypothetical protein
VIPFRLSPLALAGIVALSACTPPGPSEAELAAAAAREAELAAEARARTERLEGERLAALWTYNDVPVEKGRQVSAQIRSSNNVDTDGQGPKSVLLVFRDHAAWGRSSYLVLQGGDFDCSPRCTVSVVADDGAPVRMASRRFPSRPAARARRSSTSPAWMKRRCRDGEALLPRLNDARARSRGPAA